MHEHRFGGIEFRLGRRELGHLHGSAGPTSRFRGGSARCSSRPAAPSRTASDTGWVSRPDLDDEDVAEVIELFRSYERARVARAVRRRALRVSRASIARAHLIAVGSAHDALLAAHIR